MSAFFGHNIARGSGGGDGINPKPNKKLLSLGAGSYVTIAWKGFWHSPKFFCPPLYVQTDATLLANNSQHCWMLHVASVCTACYMLLDDVAQSLKRVKLFCQQLPTFLLFRDRQGVAQQYWIRLHSSSNTWFTKAYGLLFPTMYCRSQHCWELLHPLAHHCQHGRNDSQHCWRNSVGSCFRLHLTLLQNFRK